MTDESRSRRLANNMGLLLGPLLAALVWWWMGAVADSAIERAVAQSTVADAQSTVADAPAEGAKAAAELEPRRLQAMAALATLMAVWWLTEAIPLPATALLPLVFFPLLSILPADAVAHCYGDKLIFLFLGGFLIGLGIERSGLHRRVALSIVSGVGSSPRLLVLSFMLATAVISMWISNTATTLLVLPIAASVLLRAEYGGEQHPSMRTPEMRRFGVALMLGIGYSASIGGVATLVGTPTNVAMKQLFENAFPGAPEITFGGWMLLAAPFSILMLVLTWATLVYVCCPLGKVSLVGAGDVVREEYARLGPMSTREWRMVVVFVTTALLWMFREPIPDWGWAPALGLGKSPGWGDLVNDTTIALGMALFCFILPGEGLNGPPLLSWQATARLPWGVLLLFGGGLALASGLQATGLAKVLAHSLSGPLQGQNPWVVTTSVTFGMTYLTELTANVACVQLSLPVLFIMATEMACDPRLLMLPAVLAANCAFMMPIATPPNAIVYASGHIEVSDMIRAGFWLNLVGVVLIVLYMLLVGAPLMGASWQQLPDWATAV